MLAGAVMGLHFSAACWWEASNATVLSQAKLTGFGNHAELCF